MEINVKGHSGCQIDVVSKNGELFISKSTNDPKYIDRLFLQASKQQKASQIELQHIRVPKILDLQKHADSTIVKMQYIYSKNYIEFFEQAGFEQIDYLIEGLKYFLEYEIRNSKIEVVYPIIFQNKFIDICNKVKTNTHFDNDSLIESILIKAKRKFDNLKEMKIPIGLCHGDLTFSNILFNGNNYYLIDFLDSFIESPLQDIAKIRQDTAYYWSQLMYTKSFDPVRLSIICDKIDAAVDSYFSNKYEWYVDNYKIVQLMNILRILPYAHDVKIIVHLKKILNNLLDE